MMELVRGEMLDMCVRRTEYEWSVSRARKSSHVAVTYACTTFPFWCEVVRAVNNESAERLIRRRDSSPGRGLLTAMAAASMVFRCGCAC